MTARIGEYFNAGYIKHPAPTFWLANGEGLDSGSMMIVENNINWLIHESPRHLVWSAGHTVEVVDDTAQAYANVAGQATPPSSMSFTKFNKIPWDRGTARRFGPWPIICDEQNDSGEAIPRAVTVSVKATYSSVTLTLYTAITYGGDANPLAILDGTTVVEEFAAAASGSHEEQTLTPIGMPRGAYDRWDCRRNVSTTDTGANQIVLPVFHLWVGWLAVDGGGGSCSIDSISAWEIR